MSWSCVGALLVDARAARSPGTPTNITWKYVGDGTLGTSGRLSKVFDGGRTLPIAELDYTGSSTLPAAVKNADDLDPNNASPGYLSGHSVQISYDGSNRVQTVSDAVRNRYYAPTSPTATWTFAYFTTSGPACGSGTLHTPTQGTHGTGWPTPGLLGCTKLTPPRFAGTGKRLRVFYDKLGHPLQNQLPLTPTNYRLSSYMAQNQVAWTEDEASNPTDYTYDPFDFTLQSVRGADPDGVGPLGQPITSYRRDETVVGDATNPGTALLGLKAQYFTNATLSGRPALLQTDPNVDFDWGTGGPAGLGVTDNFSARWSGVLTVPQAASYIFATLADDGTRLTIDGMQAINQWSGQTAASPFCSNKITLSAGKHRLVLDTTEYDRVSPWCD